MEDFKVQLKCLKKKLKEAEKRAITAERTVKALLKEVDMKEGKRHIYFYFCYTPCNKENTDTSRGILH